MRKRLRGAVPVPRIFATPLSRLLSGVFVGIVIVSMLVTMPIAFAQGPSQATPTAKAASTKGGANKAQEPTALPPSIPADIAQRPIVAQDFTFESLGISSYELSSPSGIAQFRFQVPDNWFADGTNKLKLAMEYFQTGEDLPGGQRAAPSIVDVFFDERFGGSIRLTPSQSNAGIQTLTVPLSAGVLRDRTRQSHSIRIVLNATEYCKINVQTRLIIRNDQSAFHFEYRELSPQLDLAGYPRPFFNNSFKTIVESATIVLPTDKTTADLNAAATVSAGLGKLTNNRVKIHVVDEASLTDEIRKNENLLLIGRIGSHKLIDSLFAEQKFPATLSADGKVSVGGVVADPNDGVLQIIANPDNPGRAILAVTGLSDEGLNKAALALTGRSTIGLIGGPVALVAESRPVTETLVEPIVNTVLTFEDLGYQDSDLTVSGRGNRIIEVGFDVPLNTQLTEDAYVNLIFSYARRLRGARTTLSLLMNGTPFASQMLDAEDPNADTTSATDAGGQSVLKAMIPPSMVAPGERNILTINVDVEGDWNCFPPGQYGVFFTASPDSTMSLPVRTAQTEITPRVSRFPFPFDVMPDLHDLMISLPAKPSNQELEAAMTLVARLGTVTNEGKAFSPQITLGELPSGIDLASFNIIVVGRPTTNPFLAKINDSLPQPFAAGTDALQQVLDNVSVRFLPGYDLGVLQMLRSPWANNRMLLVVTGNGQKGQDSAMMALIESRPGAENMRGDIVFIGNNAVVPFDSQRNSKRVMLTKVPEDMATQVAQAPTAVQTQEPGVPPPTVTKIPTSTPTPEVTAGPSSTPTSMFTLAPSPTVPTAIPTFPPIDPVSAMPPRIDPPAWLNTLIAATFVIVTTSILFGLMLAVRRARSRA